MLHIIYLISFVAIVAFASGFWVGLLFLPWLRTHTKVRKALTFLTHNEVTPIRCSFCGLWVHRYDDRRVCANCLSEGK